MKVKELIAKLETWALYDPDLDIVIDSYDIDDPAYDKTIELEINHVIDSNEHEVIPIHRLSKKPESDDDVIVVLCIK